MSLDHHPAFPERIGRRRLAPSVSSCSLCSNRFKHSKHASPTLKFGSTSILATPRVLHPVIRQVHRLDHPKHHPDASVAHKAVILVTIVSFCRLTRSLSLSFMCRHPVRIVSTPSPLRCPPPARCSASRSGRCRRLNRRSPNISSRLSPVRTVRKPCVRSVQPTCLREALDHTSQRSLHSSMVATA